MFILLHIYIHMFSDMYQMYILHIYIYNIYTKIQTHRKEENYHLLNIHSVVMLCSNLPYTIHRMVTTVST